MPSSLSPPSSSSPPSSLSPRKICHSLPCSIDYQGMAPVHVYFHPTATQNETFCAQLRGRRLLAKAPQSVQGMILGSDKNIAFDAIQEWHHQETLVGIAKSRVEAALEWGRLATEVHKDIPVQEEEEVQQ